MQNVHYNLMNRWAAALRSGDYVQTEGALYDTETDGYCCLGVLSDMCQMPWRVNEDAGVVMYSYPTSPDGDWMEDSELPSKYWFADMLGLSEEIADVWMGDLAARNDKGQSFDRIALEIERKAGEWSGRTSKPTYPRTVAAYTYPRTV